MPGYTTMVQHFLGTLQLPMAIYILDYYLPMLSPNDGYNETGITMQSVKNVNPSTPLVYPNRRFHKITTPDANTYCGCDSAVTYFSVMSNKGTCSTPTPKCTSDSFFSLQTPHTTEQVNKNQGRHTATAHKQRKKARCSSVATVSSALGDTAVQFSSEHLTPLP